MAELNTDFFKKQFELTIGLENLKEFTEEERRELYVDFRLGYRFVEYGQCTKHFSEKPCSKISGNITCAGCPKCSTGKIYLPKWLELLKKQEEFVNDLIKNYNNSGYTDYKDFTEYKREIYFLELYRDVVKKLS